MKTPLTGIPTPATLWRGSARWGWVAYVTILALAVPHFIVQYWFNQSLGFYTLFWTNLRMQAALFIGYGVLLFLAVHLPLRSDPRPGLRRMGTTLGVWLGTLGGWLYAREYDQALLAFNGVPFRRVDPVFGHDIGFYVYQLPFWRSSIRALALAAGLGLLVSLLTRRGWRMTAGFCALLGAGITTNTFLSRYDLLLRDNEASGVRIGAEYLDLVGIVSRLNFITVMTLVEAGLTLIVCAGLVRFARGQRLHIRTLRRPLQVAGGLLVLELAFFLALVVKDHVLIAPNEPVIQEPFIQRHMDATLEGYRLEAIEIHEWDPPAEPVPPDRLLASRTVQNAPYLSSWVSYLEEPPDIQHFERIAVSESRMVYGPFLQIYDQQQKLRPYYKFLSIDGVRYRIDGEKKMFASSVRELPSRALVGPQEWLRYWGSAALLFTHGMGLVMSPTNALDPTGSPTYVVKNLPPEIEDSVFAHEPRIYFGEGLKDDYVLTNVRGLQEFDFATEQFREVFTYPAHHPDGIEVNSWFRRLVFAVYSRDLTAFLFSRYIDHDRTRVHIRRTPLSRASGLAPFLFLDSNPYAFIADGRVYWMINGLTTTDRYPYAFQETLGDKADERAVEPFPERRINYAEDAVKITLDAESGAIRFYQIQEDPIVASWARIYPDLFRPESEMPTAVRDQLTYPLQWFHVQFDDIYKRYHQRHPLEFYNVEDLWDDADETIGSTGRGLSGFGTGDQMTFSYEGYQMLLDPADLPPGVNVGTPGDLQFALLMPFTPDGARNLRSLIVAFQDPDQYGRLLSLQIPQGRFVAGPEQVDAYIDNDRPVHQQVTMWIRHGSEVIRGSTLLVPVEGDLLYLETIWVNSLQNDLPQLKLFAVRYHDRITSGTNLEEAIRERAAFEP